MKRTVTGLAALALIAGLASFWPGTTDAQTGVATIKGSSIQPPAMVTATGALLGVGQTLTGGSARRQVDIISTASDGFAYILVKSPSISATGDTATFFVAGGSSWSKYFRLGVDSLAVTALVAGDTLIVEVTD